VGLVDAQALGATRALVAPAATCTIAHTHLYFRQAQYKEQDYMTGKHTPLLQPMLQRPARSGAFAPLKLLHRAVILMRGLRKPV
jgi:hypothetical protein